MVTFKKHLKSLSWCSKRGTPMSNETSSFILRGAMVATSSLSHGCCFKAHCCINCSFRNAFMLVFDLHPSLCPVIYCISTLRSSICWGAHGGIRLGDEAGWSHILRSNWALKLQWVICLSNLKKSTLKIWKYIKHALTPTALLLIRLCQWEVR